MATAQRSRRGAPAARAEAPVKASFRGEEGRKRFEQEQKRADAERELNKNKVWEPSRFRIGVGETREIIVVDDEPSFFRYEHAIFNPRTNRTDLYLPCIAATGNCPVCAKHPSSKPYYALYMTIIDPNEYFNERLKKSIPFSKRMMVVKQMQQKKIMRLYKEHEKDGMFGMVLSMTRDSDKSAVIGDDISFVEYEDEDAMKNDYNTSYEDKDKKLVEVFGDEVFDYEAIYPDLSEEQLAALVGAEPAVGNRRSDNASIGRRGRGAAAEEDNAPVGRRATRRAEPEPDSDEDAEDATPAPRARLASRRGVAEAEDAKPATRRGRAPAVADADEDEPLAEDEVAPKPVGRRSAARRAAPEPVDTDDTDEQYDDDSAEDTPPPRTRRGAEPAAADPAPTRRVARRAAPFEADAEAAADADEDEAADEAPPPRTTAARRAAQRR